MGSSFCALYKRTPRSEVCMSTMLLAPPLFGTLYAERLERVLSHDEITVASDVDVANCPRVGSWRRQ